MNAIRVEAHGGVERLLRLSLPTPEPGPAQVRVQVKAVALNHLDLWVRRGVPGHRFPLPLVPGSDIAGVVEALGAGVDEAWLGRRVALYPASSCGRCAACVRGQQNRCRLFAIRGEGQDGGCAEYVIAGVEDLLPLPEDLGLVDAAAIPLATLTAWHMLARARARSGEVVLVLAGSSGVGAAAIRVANALGCRVYATAGTDEKRDFALDQGAQAVLPHEAGFDFARALKQRTDGRGADVVVEHTGAATMERSLRALAWGGRLVTCGATTGAEAKLDLRALFFKQQELIGSTMGNRGDMLDIWTHVAAGRLRAAVSQILPMRQIAEAHTRLESGLVLGKVVLTADF